VVTRRTPAGNSTKDDALTISSTARRRRLSRRISWRRVQDWGAAYTLLIPALVLLAIWFVYPIVESVLLSFQNVDEFNFDKRDYTGLTNYQQLLHDSAFHDSLRITLIFVVAVVPIQTVISIGIAAVLKSARTARAVFRAAFFLPYMISTVAVTTVFKELFVENGPLSKAGHAVGLPNTTWYANVHLALPFLVIVYVYTYIGLYVVIFVGGMESVPPELYEAARVDGASAWRQFISITVPSLRPFTAFVLVAGLIQAVQIFDQAYVVSNGTILGSPAGATSTLVVFIYQQAFRLNDLGYGAAAAVVLLVIVLLGTLVTRRLVPEDTA
jgi:multiple sugar transport system permease protein